MVMERLISNTVFGFYVRELEINDHKKLELRENYDSFLKQPLTLKMFVPCDSDGNVLDSYFYDQFNSGRLVTDAEMKEVEQYQEAKSKVFFDKKPKDKYEFYEDCAILNDRVIFSKSGKVYAIHKSEQYETIEDLVKYNLELTESAKQQLS